MGADSTEPTGRRAERPVRALRRVARRTRPILGERGAAMVEFAILLPIVVLLTFGIIEFGIAFNDFISVRNGTREGARLGVVNDVKYAPSCSINGVSVTPPAAPITSSDATNALVCKTKSRIGLSASKIKVKVSFAGTHTVGNNLTVCATYPVSSLSGQVLGSGTLTSEVTMRLEQVPTFDAFSESGLTC
jgi:Flp pilus assembly protein TadG